MGKNELELLRALVRNEASWCRYNCTFGQTRRNAAESLRGKKLARIVELNDFGADVRQYVVIPPNAEWDFSKMEIRMVQ